MTKFYNKAVEITANPMEFVRALERGDADSAGSTLRLVGVVFLVVAIVAVIGAAIATQASKAKTSISSNGFTTTVP